MQQSLNDFLNGYDSDDIQNWDGIVVFFTPLSQFSKIIHLQKFIWTGLIII